ncbi:MAG: hypothetical protein P8Z38_05665 [Robiginitalea sp.]
MKNVAFIWFLFLSGVSHAPLFAQAPSGSTASIEAYAALASRDAEYEHGIVFSKSGDEADYWNDQRVFEQKLLERNPLSYRSYLQGKKMAYLKHGEICDTRCGHGDYYYRQASFYLQYNTGDDGVFLTLIQSENAGGWEVTYAGVKH